MAAALAVKQSCGPMLAASGMHAAPQVGHMSGIGRRRSACRYIQ